MAYINEHCFNPDFRAKNVYQHPFVDGLMLYALTSKEEYEDAEGVLFFTDSGHIAFGYFGLSWNKFRSTGRHTILQNSANSSFAGKNAQSTVPSGWTLTSMEFANAGVLKVQTISGMVHHIDGAVSWNDTTGVCEYTYDNPFHDTKGVCLGMGIRALNAEDGAFLGSPEFGGWHTRLPFSAVPGADFKSGTLPVGYLRKRIPLSERGRGIQHAYPTLTEGMGKDELKYFNKGYHHYQQSGAAKAHGTANLVTLFTCRRNDLVATAVTGLAYPQIYPIPGKTGIVQAQYDTERPNLPTALYVIPRNMPGVVFPRVVACGDPSNSTIVTDVAGGHRLAAHIDYEAGRIVPQNASGTSLDQAMGSVGDAFANGITIDPPLYEPYPTDVDLDGLTEEEQKLGWQSVSNIGPSKSNVAEVCRMPFGVAMFPELQEDIANIYNKAVSEAKKDAKKKKKLF